MSSTDALDTDQAGLLSDAALSALQLRQQPFTSSPADGDWFTDDTTAEQLEDIKQALIAGDDLLLIMGPYGSGKSTLLSQLGANSGLRIQCFSVKGSQRFSTHNLFAGMLEAFKQKPSPDLKLMLDELIPCLQGMMGRNTLSAIVLDDADQIPEPELTTLLSGMLYINSQDETLLRVALASEPDFEQRIPELLPEGADLPYSSLTMEPMNARRAQSYLEFRLNQAGHFEQFPFTDRDLAGITERSEGVPGVLHAIAADELNQRHDPDDGSIPAELLTTNNSWFAGQTSKILIGGLACLLILGGLFLVKPKPAEDPANRYKIVEKRKLDMEKKAAELRLLKEDEQADIARADAENDQQLTTTSSTADTNSVDTDVTTTTQTVTTDNTGTTDNISTENDTTSGNSNLAANSTRTSSSNSDPATTATADTTTNAANSQATTDSTSSQVAANTTAAVELAAATGSTVALAQDPTATAARDSTAAAADSASTSINTPPVATAVPSLPATPTAAEPADHTETTNTSNTVAVQPANLESPNWILVQNKELFTVQMIADTKRESVEKFLANNNFESPNSIFSFTRKGTTWFALVHGLYPSFEEARLSIERMPETARKQQPWIRAVGRVQDALKEQK